MDDHATEAAPKLPVRLQQRFAFFERRIYWEGRVSQRAIS